MQKKLPVLSLHISEATELVLMLKNKSLSIYSEISETEKYVKKSTSSVASYSGSDRTGSVASTI